MLTGFSVQPEGDRIKVKQVLAQETTTVALLVVRCSVLISHTGLFSCPSTFPAGLTEWKETFFLLHFSLKSIESFKISEKLKKSNQVFPF